MSVSYFPVSYGIPNDDCSICWDPLKSSPVVVHYFGGETHPVHRQCIIDWASSKNQPRCPTCQKPIQMDSLLPAFSWKDRAIRELLFIIRDAWRGAERAAGAAAEAAPLVGVVGVVAGAVAGAGVGVAEGAAVAAAGAAAGAAAAAGAGAGAAAIAAGGAAGLAILVVAVALQEVAFGILERGRHL